MSTAHRQILAHTHRSRTQTLSPTPLTSIQGEMSPSRPSKHSGSSSPCHSLSAALASIDSSCCADGLCQGAPSSQLVTAESRFTYPLFRSNLHRPSAAVPAEAHTPSLLRRVQSLLHSTSKAKVKAAATAVMSPLSLWQHNHQSSAENDADMSDPMNADMVDIDGRSLSRFQLDSKQPQSLYIDCPLPSQNCPANRCATDLLCLSFSHLDVQSLLALRSVNRYWRSCSERSESWRHSSIAMSVNQLLLYVHTMPRVRAIKLLDERSHSLWQRQRLHTDRARDSAQTEESKQPPTMALMPTRSMRHAPSVEPSNPQALILTDDECSRLSSSLSTLTDLTTLLAPSSSPAILQALHCFSASRNVCKSLIILDLTPDVHVVTASGERKQPDAAVQAFSLLLDSHISNSVAGFVNLKALKLELCCRLTVSGYIALVSKCRGIVHLSVDACHLTDESLAAIASGLRHNLMSLQMLWCTRNACTQSAWQSIYRLSHLVILELSLTFELTDDRLAQLQSHCPMLRTLHAPEWSRVTRRGIALLRRMKLLRELTIASHDVRLSDAIIVEVASMPRLALLALYASDGWTDRHVHLLCAQSSRLQALVLCNCANVTVNAVAHLSKLARLECIDIVTFRKGSIRQEEPEIEAAIAKLHKSDIATWYNQMSKSTEFPTNCKDDIVHLNSVQLI